MPKKSRKATKEWKISRKMLSRRERRESKVFQSNLLLLEQIKSRSRMLLMPRDKLDLRRKEKFLIFFMNRVLLLKKLSLKSRKRDWSVKLRLQREFKSILTNKMRELKFSKKNKDKISKKSKLKLTQK